MVRRSGFTLIELLIVLVIIAVLAGIATANMWSTRERFYAEAMRNDLRGLVSMQELYYGKHMTYGEVPDLGDDVTTTEGVTLDVAWRSYDGWAATATHESAPAAQCGVFFGAAPASEAVPATVAGTITCTP